MWEEVFIAFLSFFLGLISGVIIQSLKFRYDRKLDKIRRLMPYVEAIHPIFETLMINIEHGIKLQETNDVSELSRYIIRTAEALNSFGYWYSDFVANGLKPELQSLNPNLFSGLYGIFVYHQMTKSHGVEFISQNLKDIRTKLKMTMGLIEEFLKQ